MTTRDELFALVRTFGELGDAEALVGLAVPSIHLRAARTPLTEIAIGMSRFGGVPDVPTGFRWPTRGKRPLSFLAQLDLDAMGAPGLPARGSLLFFYDDVEQPWGLRPEDHDAWAVVHVAAGTKLQRSDGPGEDVRAFAAARVTPHATFDLPHVSDALMTGRLGSGVSPEWEAYRSLTYQLDPEGPRHRLLGHPHLVQGDLRGECQLASNGLFAGDPDAHATPAAKKLLASANETWTQLLQLDTDETGTDWMWGDVGCLYFMIRREDLAAARFDRVWLVLQCC